MAEADHDYTSSQYEWVFPRDYVKRIAGDPAAETEAECSIEERFRRGELPYRYRAGNGELHYNDLSDEFRREAVIDFAAATATRSGRIILEANPDLPLVRDNLSPQPQWVGDPFSRRDFDPFSRPDHIERELPAEAVTELKFAVSRAPTAEPAMKSAPPDVEHPPRKPRRVVQGPQDSRLEIKLKVLFPKGIPSDQELANPDLVRMVVNAFEKDPMKIPGLGIPSRKTILRVAGRIPRKK